MALENIDALVDEINSIRAWQGRRDRVTARAASFTPDDVSRVATYTRMYPNVPFGIIEPFAKENIPPDHPMTQMVMKMAYNRNAAEGGGPANKSAGFSARLAANIARNKLGDGGTELDGPKPYVEDLKKTDKWDTSSLPSRLLMLERARIENQDPLDFEQILRRQGLLDSDGMLRRPGGRKFNRDSLENPDAPTYIYEDERSERQHTLFDNLMKSIAAENPGEDIPFLTDTPDGERLGFYHPRTGNYSLVGTSDPAVKPADFNSSLLGGVIEGYAEHRARAGEVVKDWSERRIETPWGKQTTLAAGGPNTNSARGMIQAASMFSEAMIQEPVGQMRNVRQAMQGEDVDWMESQSDLGISLQRMSQGKSVDVGRGYFVDPESEIAKERYRREAERGLIGGHVVTPGRWAADSMNLSVDSKPFTFVSGSIDLAKEIFDPAAWGYGAVAKADRARQLFSTGDEAKGLFKGVRNHFEGPTWDAYSRTDEGRRVVDTIAAASGDKSSPYDYWKIMGEKHDPDLIARLYDADTPEKVDAVFRSVVGTQIKSPKEINKLPMFWQHEALDALNPDWSMTKTWDRILNPNMMPHHSFNPSNKLESATQLDRWLRAGRASDYVRKETFNRVARADGKNGVEQAAEWAMYMEQGVLHQAGINSLQRRRELTRLFTQHRNAQVDALLDELGADTPIRDILMVNGKKVQDISPQLTMEYIGNKVPLPDVTRIRRLTADPKYRWLLTFTKPSSIGKERYPVTLMNAFVDDVWKPAMLIGRFPAWITRVVGEEQARMAAAGLNSMFTHPIAAFATMIGRTNKKTLTGDLFDDLEDFQSAVIRGHGGNLRRPGATRNAPTLYGKADIDNHDQFISAYAEQIGILNKDPISRALANHDVDWTVDWLIKGQGRTHLRTLRAAEPGEFLTETQIRTYLTDVLAARHRLITNNNPDLLEAIRTGKLRNERMFRRGGVAINPKVNGMLEDFMDDAPDFVKGFEAIPGDKQMNKWNDAVNWMFAHTMTATTNFASRSPTYKQFLWRQAADLIPYADDATKAAVLRNAKEANVSNNIMKQLKKRAQKNGDVQFTSVDDLQNLASGYALDDTKKLLYDLAERGQFAESLNIVSPFANAFQEVMTTWPKILWGPQYSWTGKAAKTAQVSRRVQQVIEGGRDSGFFAENEYGEEVFVFPFSEAFTEAVAGVPVPLTGRVEGLNMVFDVTPGLGPVAAVPLSWMLEGKPGGIRDFYDEVFPYGAPGERDPNQALNVLSYAPSWMQKMALALSAGPPPGVRQALEKVGLEDWYPTKDQVMWDNTAYMNVQKDVMKYLLSTGDYDPSTREGMQELLEEAKTKATDLYYIRASMQFFAPTAPAFEFLVQDKDGHLMAQTAVTEAFYHNLDEGMSLDEATFELIDKYGLEIFSLTVPKTRTTTYNVPRTREGGEWVRANKDIKLKYPGVYGFFAPQGGDLDYSELARSYATGDTEILTPSEWLNLRNDMLKSMEYNYYRDQVGQHPNDEERAWLRQIRSELEEVYPSSSAGLLDKPDHEELIPELYAAASDPKLRDTEMGQGLNEYFYYRDQAQAQAEAADFATFANPQAMRGTREWLAGIALEIMDEYPEFELAWTTVLSREFERELR